MTEAARTGSDAIDRYLVLMTQPAAASLGLAGEGMAHQETYPDVGAIDARIVDLAEAAGIVPGSRPAPVPGSDGWPELRVAG